MSSHAYLDHAEPFVREFVKSGGEMVNPGEPAQRPQSAFQVCALNRASLDKSGGWGQEGSASRRVGGLWADPQRVISRRPFRPPLKNPPIDPRVLWSCWTRRRRSLRCSRPGCTLRTCLIPRTSRRSASPLFLRQAGGRVWGSAGPMRAFLCVSQASHVGQISWSFVRGSSIVTYTPSSV